MSIRRAISLHPGRSAHWRLSAPGIAALALACAGAAPAQTGRIPEGFTPIFNGKDLKGWHISRTNHHGPTPDVAVENGMIVLKQFPFGMGGVILSDKKYKDFELYIEVNPDWGCNSGIFLRSAESATAYQIELMPKNNNLALIGEVARVSKGATAPDADKVWKEDQWNAIRVRMAGEIPHVTLWLNDVQMYDVTCDRNDMIADARDGMIGLQTHWLSSNTATGGTMTMNNSWKPGAALRFRSIAIKEIK
jgi:hypothetical protein